MKVNYSRDTYFTEGCKHSKRVDIKESTDTVEEDDVQVSVGDYKDVLNTAVTDAKSDIDTVASELKNVVDDMSKNEAFNGNKAAMNVQKAVDNAVNTCIEDSVNKIKEGLKKQFKVIKEKTKKGETEFNFSIRVGSNHTTVNNKVIRISGYEDAMKSAARRLLVKYKFLHSKIDYSVNNSGMITLNISLSI